MGPDQIVSIVRDLVRLGDLVHVKFPAATALPDDLARLKERLDELNPDGGPKRVADYDLVLHIGLILQEHGQPPTMGDLSDELGVPLSTATRIIDWLVRSRYIERLADSQDRRIVRVALTEMGEKLYESITEFLRRRVEGLLEDFSAPEREELVRLLAKFVDAVEREVGG